MKKTFALSVIALCLLLVGCNEVKVDESTEAPSTQAPDEVIISSSDEYTLELSEKRTTVEKREGIPTDFEYSKSFYDLIFYDEDGERQTKEDLSYDAPWRQEALDRIEDIRKGDIKVVVTDQNGTPIQNAKTEIEMYEHEFEWGVGLSEYDSKSQKFLEEAASTFNSAVLINELKWSKYEESPQRAKSMVAALNSVGINKIRGHCLIWDRNRRQNDTSVPADLPSLYNDKEALNERIESHIEEIMTDMKGLIFEWDVLNEACNNITMQTIHGREIVKEWFDMAAKYGGAMDLYYNDFMTSGLLFDLLNEFEELGVVYDGIGIQSHYSSPKDMTDIYNFYKSLSEYGKKLKVTEYDFATDDEILQAEFTRDLMILTFSMENFEGFYLWGMRGGDGNRYVCYRSDFTPKPALEQMQDLIYNKWFTKNSGRTDGNGEFSTRGYYGSYEITVTANGTKKTVLVDCHKGEDNTVRIVMP